MRITQHIPNFITLLNLTAGCVALVSVSMGDFVMAFYFVCLGIFLDFFDGFFARLLNASGPLGLQLDSLADMVTSGVVPGFVMYSMMTQAEDVHNFPAFFPYLGFLITLGSCYRLAFFNIDTRQTDYFIGLPTPANALFILSLPLILIYTESLIVLEILINPWFLLVVTLLSAFMMNASVPLFSLKMKNFSLKNDLHVVVFLFLAVILLIFLQYAGIPLIIISYILISMIFNRKAVA